MQKNTSEPFEFLGIIHKLIKRFLLIFFDEKIPFFTVATLLQQHKLLIVNL